MVGGSRCYGSRLWAAASQLVQAVLRSSIGFYCGKRNSSLEIFMVGLEPDFSNATRWNVLFRSFDDVLVKGTFCYK